MSDSNRERWGDLSPKQKEEIRKDEEIEALRRRVAELEEKVEHYDTAEYHLSQMVKSLTAENAELKRQVEALSWRDAAQVFPPSNQVVRVRCKGGSEHKGYINAFHQWWVNDCPVDSVTHWKHIDSEAAKGEVE